MKNLITKTLFVSLLFSAVAPAIKAVGSDIQASEAGITAFEADTQAANEAIQAAIEAEQQATIDRQFFPEVLYPELAPKVPVSVGFFPGLAATLTAKAVSFKNGAVSSFKGATSYIGGSYVGKKAQGAYSYSTGKASDLRNGAANLMAKYPKTTTGLRYSAYATGIVAAGYAAYKAYNSEKVRNNVSRFVRKAKNTAKKASNKAKNAWNNSSKYVRYGVLALLATTALYAGAVHQGYALSPSKTKDALSLTWKLRNWKVPVIAWKVNLARSA